MAIESAPMKVMLGFALVLLLVVVVLLLGIQALASLPGQLAEEMGEVSPAVLERLARVRLVMLFAGVVGVVTGILMSVLVVRGAFQPFGRIIEGLRCGAEQLGALAGSMQRDEEREKPDFWVHCAQMAEAQQRECEAMAAQLETLLGRGAGPGGAQARGSGSGAPPGRVLPLEDEGELQEGACFLVSGKELATTRWVDNDPERHVAITGLGLEVRPVRKIEPWTGKDAGGESEAGHGFVLVQGRELSPVWQDLDGGGQQVTITGEITRIAFPDLVRWQDGVITARGLLPFGGGSVIIPLDGEELADF